VTLGGLHASVVVLLLGSKMANRFDLQPGWRQRYGMDEFGVVRLKKAVTRGAAALPSLIFWALGPKQPGDEGGFGLLAMVAAVLAASGLYGMLRLRTWGLLAVGGAAVAALFATPPASTAALPVLFGFHDPHAIAMMSPGVPGAVALLLFAAVLPFAGAAVRYFRSLR
jgi:hypothetical protein